MKKLLCSLVLAVFLVSSVNAGEAFGLKVPLPPGVKEEQITVYEGWNLIGIPGLPHFGPYTVGQFVEDVEHVWDGTIEVTPQGAAPAAADSDFEYVEPAIRPLWKVRAVSVYKDGRFRKLLPRDYSYNMVPGEAYFVYARFMGVRPVGGIGYVFRPSKIVRIAVRPLKHISYNLDKGWNGMSMGAIGEIFQDGTRLVTCSSLRQLSEELEKQEIKATKIAFWSQDNQEWVVENLPMEGPIVVNPFDMPSLYDRMIGADEGFFLFCDENGLFFLPELDTDTDPPLPPDYVEHMGAVNRAEPGNPYEYVILVSAGHNLPAYSEIPLIYEDEEIHGLLESAVGTRFCVIRGEAIKIEVNGLPMDAVVVREVELPLRLLR